MEMGAGGVAGGTHGADYIALVDVLTVLYVDIAHMRVKGLDSVAVVDDNVVTVTGVAPFYLNNGAGGGSINV